MYTQALQALIEEFQKLPGIGPKSAQRMAFAVLKKTQEQNNKFIKALKEAKENIFYCEQCFNLTSQQNTIADDEVHICEICSDPRRNLEQLCVVEDVKDLIAIEKTKEFRGRFHVLGGVISPLDGISADDLSIPNLLLRLEEFVQKHKEESNEGELELILAIGLSTEGEATILYLKRLITVLLNKYQLTELSSPIRITRLAYGLPVGADLDYADETTIAKALEARVLC